MAPNFAIVFDIDGVLYKYNGGMLYPIPGAGESLSLLRRLHVPHIFLTNGTGSTEDEKAASLSKLFNLPFTARQFVLSTTPMRSLAETYSDQRVLVVARTREFSLRAAAHYGFHNAVSLQDYVAGHPQLYPSRSYAPPIGAHRDAHLTPVRCVLLVSPPEDWGEAMQVVADVARSDGIPGSDHEALEQIVPVYAANPDFDYGALHSVPRLTLGAFLACLELVYERSTGRTLQITRYGKPFPEIYSFANASLAGQSESHTVPSRVYAIGDNPASDIRGANAHGWRSVLVRTGVFRAADNDQTDPATHVCDTVKEAVDWILDQEGMQGQ